MKKVVIAAFMCLFYLNAQTANQILPSDFWSSLSESEKISFVNGAYGAISLLKRSHKNEVAKQYLHDKNWIQPYYIERFYEIADEYLSEQAGYNLSIIVMHLSLIHI